jgi:alkylation response protein AidB-like acyl-CoA dehydrogenase
MVRDDAVRHGRGDRVDRADHVREQASGQRPADFVNRRGRRSVGVDLKNPSGAEVVLRLAERADALIEGEITEEYGGLGLGLTESAIMMEEVAASGAGMSGASAIHFYVFPPAPILRHGSEEMKRAWLPKLARGEILMAFGVTEPTAGVDTSRIKTRAEKIDGGFSYAKEYHIERLWREVRLLRLAPISQEMVLNFISTSVLGLPRSY